MRIAVTGGAGFIGSNLTARLLSEGHEVVVVDNFDTGSKEVAELLMRRGAKVHGGRSSFLTRLGEFDAIFHLGMPSSSPMYRENPSLVASVVSEATDILEYARKVGCRVIFASTSSLYNGHDPPHREDMEVFPTDLYTEARYWLERLTKVYHDLYGVESVGLRLFSVYGPNERPKGKYANVVSQMIWAALEGRPFVIYGDGNQTRDFIYVADVVEAFLAAWRSGVGWGIYNVGTGVETTFNELAELISEVLGAELKVERVPNPIKNYVYRTCADITRAEAELGFRAGTPLREGIKRLVEVYERGELTLAT